MIYVYNNIYIYQAKAGSGVFFMFFLPSRGRSTQTISNNSVLCSETAPVFEDFAPCRSMGVERWGFSPVPGLWDGLELQYQLRDLDISQPYSG
jgi:hypothetical protein